MADGEPVPAAAKKSDLGVRTLSAVVMIAIAATAFALGDWWLKAFVLVVAAAAYFELARMVLRADFSTAARTGLLVFGLAYVGAAAWILATQDPFLAGIAIVLVMTTDISAYFSGRKFGKRKIAPSISPSKTWAGLFGAMIMTGALLGVLMYMAVAVSSGKTPEPQPITIGPILFGIAGGALLAAIAQAGDFFESWLKRRAGMKDSSNLIPGHGGVFDRIDGLIPVTIALGLVFGLGNLS